MLLFPKNYENFFLAKWIDPLNLKEKILQIKQKAKIIVTLNGSFDLLHAGHLHIIYEAAQQGDCLIIALNSDSSIQKYKSPLRPIVPLEYRMKLVAGLAFVDYVTSFDETHPCQILETIQPHVHVNGSEYGNDCIEAETIQCYGGRLHLVDRIPGLSTSHLIQKVMSACE